jgi:hypothetical protein
MLTFRHLVGRRANLMSWLFESLPTSDNNLKNAESRAIRGPRSLEKGGACRFCEVMPKPETMKHLRLLGLLSFFAVAACTQPSFLSSSADQPAKPKERLSPGSATPDRWEPAPDPVFEEVMPGTERISQLPGKVGECMDTTITSITDRYGEDLSARAKKGSDPGTLIRFSNSGVQVSLKRENAIVHSQIFDKVNMCLVEVPKECPNELRGRVYRTTNLRTKETWSLANDIRSCG